MMNKPYIPMKADDYTVGDKCLYYHTSTDKIEEIVLEERDMEYLKRYENSAFEGFWYRPLNK